MNKQSFLREREPSWKRFESLLDARSAEATPPRAARR